MDTASASGEASGEQWVASMADVHQAAGMLTVQLGVTITEAFVRLHDYATDADRSVDDVACDIIDRRLHMSPAADHV
jgi:AmiR/NasT family two-component response regulator